MSAPLAIGTSYAGPSVDAGEVLGGLLYRSHLLAPGDLADTVADQARLLGAESAVIYLLDYGQTHLIPLPSADAAERCDLTVEGTLGGRALRCYEIVESAGDEPGGRRLWVPLLDGTERLGVLELCFPAVAETELSDRIRDVCSSYASLVAELLVSKRSCGDAMELVRRRRPLSLAAEVQWRMLPPLTFATDALVISAILEPWSDVGGDSFDYAVNGDIAHVAVFDAMGHGLDAALLASVTTAAYRLARRDGMDLRRTFGFIDSAIKESVGGERFTTALMAQISISTGALRWVSAGHPAPLLLRGGKLINRLELPPSPPLGLSYDGAVLTVGEETLEPADRLVLYTDGVVEARTADGEFFGVERLGELVVRECASGAPAPEALRRLGRAVLEAQDGRPTDDATTLLVEWTGGGERTLLL